MRRAACAVLACTLALCCGRKTDEIEKEKEKARAAAAEAEPEATAEPPAPAPVPSPAKPARRASDATSDPMRIPVRPDPKYRFRPLEEIAPERSVRALVDELAEPVYSTKLRKKFERLGIERAAPVLLAATYAPVPNIRHQAADILRRLDYGGDDFTARLKSMLLSDPDPDVRGRIALVAVYYRKPEIRPALAEVLAKDPYAGARENAARAIRATRDGSYAAALVDALKDKATKVRLFSVSGLAKMSARSAIDDVVAMMLQEENDMVLARSLETLIELGAPVKVNGKRAGSEKQLPKLVVVGSGQVNKVEVHHKGKTHKRDFTFVVWPGE